MRRADRLFQIIQLLRQGRRAITATDLGRRLGVSARTIYRDIRDLIDSGVPIAGEAGVGYALSKTYDLPPLMFDEDELEALVLGARIVETWADRDLARAANMVLSKVEAVVPDDLRPRLESSALFAFDFRSDRQARERLGVLRLAVREQRKIQFGYIDRHEAKTQRIVQPLGLFYWGATWTLAAWCELRDGFRNFRIDRLRNLTLLDQVFVIEPGKSLQDLFRLYRESSHETPRDGESEEPL